ncbi:MAG: PqqD family protein [Thermomicrobiales bacterium]
MRHDVDLVWADATVPAARAVENFSASEIGDEEIVLFDNERLTYHTLNKPAFSVWQLCDGVRTGRDISRALSSPDLPLPVESVEIAVCELHEAGLLAAEPHPTSRVSRRQVMKLAAAGVAGGALLPAVSSITAPASANLTTCTPGADLGFLEACNCSSECDVLGFFNPGRCCCSSILGQACVAPGACIAGAFCMSG